MQDNKNFVNDEIERIQKLFLERKIPAIFTANYDDDPEHLAFGVVVPDVQTFFVLWGSVAETMAKNVSPDDRKLFIRWLRQVMKHVNAFEETDNE